MKKVMAILAAAAVLALAGCGGEPETPVLPTAEGKAVIGTSTPLTGSYFFTDAWGSCEADADIQSLLLGAGTVSVTEEGVFNTDAATLKSATIREERDGGRTYVFTLNDGLCYSDGSPITAKDYVFSVLLQSSKEFSQLDGADNTRYRHLVGWEDFSSGKSPVFTGVRLLSDSQFSLTIRTDMLPYYQELKLVEVYPYPMSILAPDAAVTDDGGAGWTGVTAESLRKTILGEGGYRYFPSVTAGPYSLASVGNGQSGMTVQLSANPYYNGGVNKVTPTIGALEISWVDPVNLSGMEGYDLICNISGRAEMDAAMRLLDRDEIRCYFYDSAELSAILFGESVSENVRKVVAAILDHDECAVLLAGRWGSPITGLNPSGSLMSSTYYSDLRRYSAQWYDLALAEELLGGAEPSLTFLYDNTDIRGEEMAALLIDMAEQSGLLTIQAEGVSTKELISRRQSGSYEMLFFDDSLPIDAAPWTGPEQLTGEKLLAAADDLAHTPGAFTDRYQEKWLTFQQVYQESLPALGICGYERCDLVGERLRNYQDVTAYKDWTSLILTATILETEG